MAREDEFKLVLDGPDGRRLRVLAAQTGASANKILTACYLLAIGTLEERPGLITLLQPGILATREHGGKLP